ncbi:MAG: hypothetical protein AB8G77_04930 [Rhodothermales bacterium]
MDITQLPNQPPDCSKSNLSNQEQEWCNGRVPVGTELTKISNSLSRIASKGGACYAVAGKLGDLLTNGNLKIFDFSSQAFGGAAPLGGDWMIIANTWLTTWEINKTSTGLNLDATLTHEADHLLINTSSATDAVGHLLGSGGVHTLNSQASS